VKSAVEPLNPTRVRLTVEVPFAELAPSLDAAYKKIAKQVRVPGFRPGRVPPRIIDQRFGRALVLEEAVNEALPRFYGQAVQDNDVEVLGQPEVDVTEFADGAELKFTAEVDIRPAIELPAYDGLPVTVPDADVTDADVDEQVQGLRERFAVLTGANRPAQIGDFVSIDLAASRDGQPIEDATASGLSYEVGSGAMLEGLDEALVGLSAGEATTFTTKLFGSEAPDADAEVAVTVNSVKVRELPEPDDAFAQMASEFDTLEELRADIRARLERVKKLQQGAQARDNALEALLERVDVPLPEGVVSTEVEWRQQSLQQQLDAAGLTKEDYLRSEGRSEEEFDAEIAERARAAVKAQFVLDAVASKEQISVTEAELTEHVVQRATRAGVNPKEYAQQAMEAGQIRTLVGEVVRGKALARVLDAAAVTDESGRPVDLEHLREDGPAGDPSSPQATAAETAGPPGEAHPLGVEVAEQEQPAVR